jgi:hypothetical protein
MDWMNESVKSFKMFLEMGKELYNDLEKAVAYAKQHSCSGKKAQEIAISEFKNEPR